MEVTGQAFEDMQEQNSRLIQQLREKDDANFKLMSERIKSNQIQRLAREERDMLMQQVNTLGTQVIDGKPEGSLFRVPVVAVLWLRLSHRSGPSRSSGWPGRSGTCSCSRSTCWGRG